MNKTVYIYFFSPVLFFAMSKLVQCTVRNILNEVFTDEKGDYGPKSEVCMAKSGENKPEIGEKIDYAL